METIDGWEVDRAAKTARGIDSLAAEVYGNQLRVWVTDRMVSAVPVRVARILLGDEPRKPCPSCGAWEASAEEAREIRSELLAAVAALTGTSLLPCPCGGHLTDDARAQCKAAQSGWTAEGALPWRPAVGGRCLYFLDGEWRHVIRIEDCRTLQCFELLNGSGMQLDCDSTYDGIRPPGSLPVPASVRAKAEA